ncbi:hypothetical protein HU200_058860 [Digitaria exilis]|uniref:Uncharacterized protein n=1 Tax=Digitaria exilis TaxID=1010633 RepID=A0A835ABY3_9POAL|nr:hypothetical protein HU200_058860 [Digitaria exilis]
MDALSPESRKVIHDHGLGTLLQFDKCFVIPLTRESVYSVFRLPMTEKPFPSDFSGGKSRVLSKFQKQSIPSVNFFASKLINHDPMSDEDTLICFILVAIGTFLCPNSSLIPSYKYFEIFEDVSSIKELDWCGFILNWLLDVVKKFNAGKASKECEGGTLGGCLYYLAVIYLDFVNFGVRQVPDDIPRIAVWKGEMIKEYSSFDMKSSGCYGCHPLLDISATCNSKDMIFLQNRSSLLLDDDFCEKLDSYSGCKLPVVLKEKICNLIQTFCFNPRIAVNLDVNSINGLPEEMKKSFCNLLNYVSNINSRTPKLILDLVKLFADSADTYDPNIVRSTPEVEIVGEKTLSDKVREMSNKSDALYNSNLRNSGASASTPVVVSPHGPSTSRPQSLSFRARHNSTGGKMPRYGPRRLLNPGPLFQGDFYTSSNKISVSKSQIDNYKAICKLASSEFQGLVCSFTFSSFKLISFVSFSYHFSYWFTFF